MPLLAFAALGMWSLGTKQVRLLVSGVRGVGVVERVEVITTSTKTKWDRYGHSESDASRATFLHLAVAMPDGGVARAKTRVTFNTPAQVGDRHPVIFVPSDPERAQILTGGQFWGPLVVGSVVTLACAAAGGWLVWSCRRSSGTTGRTWRPASPVPDSGRFVPAARPNAGGRKWLGNVAAHAIGFVGCVGLPAMFTFAAPVGRVVVSRDGEVVTARTRTCLLFVVPFRSATVSPLTSVGRRVVGGSMTRTTRSGRNEYHRSEDQGFLELKGPNGSTEVPVTPHDLEDVKAKVADFLNDPAQDRLSLFVVANWKFSVLGGGLASLMTLLYAVGLVATVATRLWRLVVPRSATPSENSRHAGDRIPAAGN